MLKRKSSHQHKTPGMSPGTLIYTGQKTAQDTRIDLFQYNEDWFDRFHDVQVDKIHESLSNSDVKWFNVVGLKNVETIQKIGDIFGLDKLVLEDILNVKQRPKVEFREDFIFIVLRMYHHPHHSNFVNEQLSIVIKDNTIITFQEERGDIFKPIRQRIRKVGSTHKNNKADYLLYTILDLLIDHYILIIDRFWEDIDMMDNSLNNKTNNSKISNEIYALREINSFMRKQIFPVKDLVNTITKSDSSIIHQDSRKYLIDLSDHALSVNDILDNQREILADLLSLYHTQVNNKMNETMKILTIISTIFIPLSFITGLYGMNFINMPELQYEYGYYSVLGLMLLLGASMLYSFKKMKWI